MFYEVSSTENEFSTKAKLESAIVCLNPSESKRLIAKAVSVLPEVKAACKKGTVVIAWGSTNALVVEELLSIKLAYKTDFASGVICEGELNANHIDTKMMPFVLKDGKQTEIHQRAALTEFQPGDVFIKGANALDANGDIGILVAAPNGGTIQEALFAITGRGGHFICPVGLEKLIPSVKEACQKCGIFHFKYSMGLPAALITSSVAKVITEIQAIRVLTGAKATHVSSGGIGGSEGAVILVIEGEPPILDKAFGLIKSVKGESPFPSPRKYAIASAADLDYDAKAIFKSWKGF